MPAWGNLKGWLTGDYHTVEKGTEMKVTFLNHTPTPEEVEAYRRHAESRYPTALSVLVDFDGDDAVLSYEFPAVPFERIRRITGYLSHESRFNNAKQHELTDRVTHNALEFKP